MDTLVIRVKVSEIGFDRKYYTRTESQSPAKVQEYAISIADGQFPPILVARLADGTLIVLDGWHRWKAAIEAGLTELDAIEMDITGLDEFTIRRKSARDGARFGLPYTEQEIKKLIRDEYRAKLDTLDQAGREQLKHEMGADYSRSLRYIQEVTSRIDRDYKAELRETAFNMWLACYTQEDIAEAIGYSQKAISEFVISFQDTIKRAGAFSSNVGENTPLTPVAIPYHFEEETNGNGNGHTNGNGNSLGTYHLEARHLLHAQHVDEQYKPPLYNIWKQQNKSNGSAKHPGNSEETWLDHLLYLYTEPLDIVIDPFAGSGSTIDRCKDRLRRYLVSDRKPIDLRSDIRQHDITAGVLAPPVWKSVSLVYLDPPYWKQVEGDYSDDPTDLANMPLDTFTDTLQELIRQYAERIRRARAERSVIAMLMQPTQWRAPEHHYTDHIADLLRAVKLPLDMRFSVPYESQQYPPQMVEWAKANKKCLVLTRELVVWRVA
jgi:hypothetical protein